MRKRRFHLAWLVLCVVGFSGVRAVSQDETQSRAAGPVAVPCGLVVVNVDLVEEISHLPFVFITGYNDWKTTVHGLSPLHKKSFRLSTKKKSRSAVLSQENPSSTPSTLWIEGSNTRIWLDLFYYAWVVLAVAALMVLVINYRMKKTLGILVISAIALLILPGIVMSNIKSGKIIILVDNSLKESFQFSIDNRYHFTLKPKSQLLLALKEGKRAVELSETKDYLKTSCVLNAVKVRDKYGKPEKGFYILNIHGFNKYHVNWY